MDDAQRDALDNVPIDEKPNGDYEYKDDDGDEYYTGDEEGNTRRKYTSSNDEEEDANIDKLENIGACGQKKRSEE